MRFIHERLDRCFQTPNTPISRNIRSVARVADAPRHNGIPVSETEMDQVNGAL